MRWPGPPISQGEPRGRIVLHRLPEYGEEIAAASPLGRIGRPDDMAGVAVYLSGRAGAWATGAIIPVDGGI